MLAPTRWGAMDSPLPTGTPKPFSVMAGWTTFAVRVAVGITTKPGTVTDTSVAPVVSGRNPTPPAATLVGVSRMGFHSGASIIRQRPSG